MKPFIVCEMSANHLGSLPRALDIVDAAAKAGADAIKVQTWSPGTMCIDKGYTLDSGPWKGRRLAELYEEAWLPWEWHAPIFERAREWGIEPFSAAFDCASVDFLETLGVKRHKVASFELTDLPLIRYMESKGKPMYLSLGMATNEEISAALDALQDHSRVKLLKCTSAYPADASEANLAAMTGCPSWGLSDHTIGMGVACAAAALGATYIEKHLTLSRADGGPDAGFSMEPQEFAQMVTEVRRAAASIGKIKHGPGPSESTTLRRSLWVAIDTKAGDPLILGENVVTARPALGLHPDTDLTDAVAPIDIKAGTPLREIKRVARPIP